MAYVPPHKRYTEDDELFSQGNRGPSSSGCSPDRKKDRWSRGEGIITYAEGAEHRRWSIGLAEDDQPSDSGSSQTSPWVSIARKILPDLLTCFQNIRNEEESGQVATPLFMARFGYKTDYRFNANVPSSFMNAIASNVVQKIGVVDVDKEYEYYHFKVNDKSQPNVTLSCTCSLNEVDGEWEPGQKIEVNPTRHLVHDIACHGKKLDLRLMLSTRKLLTVLNESEKHELTHLIKYAVQDLEAQGRISQCHLQSFGRQYKIIEAWHTKSTSFNNPLIKLKVKDGYKFNCKSQTKEDSRDISIEMTRVVELLQDQAVDSGLVNKMLEETLKLIWDNLLSYDEEAPPPSPNAAEVVTPSPELTDVLSSLSEEESRSGSSSPQSADKDGVGFTASMNSQGGEFSSSSEKLASSSSEEMRCGSEDNNILEKFKTDMESRAIPVPQGEEETEILGYNISISLEDTLKAILEKHGDIGAPGRLRSGPLRSYTMAHVCALVKDMQKTKVIDKQKLLAWNATLCDAEKVEFDVRWLRKCLNETASTWEYYMGLARRVEIGRIGLSVLEKEVEKAERVAAVLQMRRDKAKAAIQAKEEELAAMDNYINGAIRHL
ncbi:PREDICTED: uncharacterized protein LOC104590203 isoform X2 [Nelumbo nucifera]|uniref:Uncharacterized protein LOC104590203 isoform X2 n=1 Tax=Nelumbo nucifera TaxID=4432 RepID=A0A1U7Z7X7_NELNU|nr:PREDICTED: uncharacterized protein LOC104590203 isoform X2 [Nelumbo nucifera]